MSSVDGKVVVEWIGFMERMYGEIRALNDYLSNSLSRALADAGSTLGCVANGNLDENWGMDEGEYLCISVARNQGLRKSKKSKNSERWLGWQISLAGDGISVPGVSNPEPLLHVFCWSTPVDMGEMYVGFPLGNDETMVPSLLDNQLVIWGDPDGSWNEREWLYSLRLFALRSPKDVDEMIVNPALGLLKGGGAKEHLSGDRFGDALIRYPSIESLVGGG